MVKLERYAGDLRLQKSFTPDYLTHKVSINQGELPQYYVKNHHPAIISRELFESAQQVIQRHHHRDSYGDSKSGQYPLSRCLICPKCGSFYHTYNRKSYPIWICGTSRLNNGKEACPSQWIYEEQIARMLRHAILERYPLMQGISANNHTADDIMNGHYMNGFPSHIPIDKSDLFMSRMRTKLEAIHTGDNVERDRSFLNRQLFLLQTARDTLLTSNAPDSKFEEEIQENIKTEGILLKKKKHLEKYWAELEENYEWRKAALEWMDTLPSSQAGLSEFLHGLTTKYVKAIVLSITVHSPLKYTIHWFDDTSTKVEMHTNIERS